MTNTASVLPFSLVWKKVNLVDGWLTLDEAGALWRAANTVADDGLIVEVGSYMGRSTTLLAEAGRRVLMVDDLEFGRSVAKNKIDQSHVAALEQVYDRYPLVKWSRTKSTDAPLPKSVDMLYIDGFHGWPQPKLDFLHFESALVPGAIVAFHDMNETGPARTVGELTTAGKLIRLEHAGSMYIGEYQR